MILSVSNLEKSNWQRVAFFISFVFILAFALFVRVYDIDLRPLHNDEGVNYYFFNNIRSDGFYHYSHKNYHGPSYFYLSTWLTNPDMLGVSEFGMRSSAIFIGVASILLLLLLKPLQGRCFTLLAALLLASSSSLVFYSRYAIHESLLVFAGVWLGFSIYSWWKRSSVSAIYQAGVAGALLITTKETFIITLFNIFCAYISLGGYKRCWRAISSQWQHVLWSLLLLIMIVVVTFTGGFQWMEGLREMFLAVPQWVGRNTSDGAQVGEISGDMTQESVMAAIAGGDE